MTWTKVQNTSATGSGNISKAYTSNVTAGNTCIAAATCDPNTTCTFSSTGDSWTTVVSFFNSVAGQKIFIGIATNVTGGAKTVTATFGSASTFSDLIIAEYSGGPTTTTTDGSTAGQHLGTSTTPTDSPGLTTTIDGDLIMSTLVMDSLGSTITAGSGFTLLGQEANGLAFEAGPQASHGTIAPAFGASPSVAVGIISTSLIPGGAAATSVGTKSTNRHPGKGPGTAKFIQSPRPTVAGNIVNIDGSLVVTATRTAAIAITHVVGGSLTVTANRTAAIAITHTVGGSLTVTVNRTAAIAITHTVGGSLVVTVNRTAAIAITHTIGGTRPITANRTAAIAITHTVGGSLVVTVNRTAAITATHTIGGTRLITVNLAGVATVTHTIAGTRPITVTLTASMDVVGGFSSLFLPFF